MSSLERFGGAATTTAIWVLVAIIGFFLLTEHQAHVFGILPWLFLLACPAMHLLMHRGHHHHHGDGRSNDGPGANRGSGAGDHSERRLGEPTHSHDARGGVS